MKIRRKTKGPNKARKGQPKKKKKTVLPPDARKKNGQFKKGVSGNPAGMPPGTRSKIPELMAAIEAVQERRGDNWLQHQIEKSYEDTTLATAIMGRLHPSLKAIEMSGKMEVGRMSEEEAEKIRQELKKKYDK